MTDWRLSATTKNLFAAAKADVPSTAARTKVWTGVSASVGGAAIAGASGSMALTGGAGATKLLTIGALFGGSVAVGLATVVIQLRPVPTVPNTVLGQQEVAVQASNPPARSPATEAMWVSSPFASSGVGPAAVSPKAKPAAHVHAGSSHTKAVAHDDALAHEASLVAEARSALGRGDPRTALRVIRSARALPSRQLMPEELAVEEHALRVLGRSDEANGIDVQLRLQYPEAALAR